MTKVKLDVLKPWITQKITEILKMEDDVVIDYVNNQLEEKVLDLNFLIIFIKCQ
jgi:serine/arginine repetitive matrix protein 1